jgi:hypothetical protein
MEMGSLQMEFQGDDGTFFDFQNALIRDPGNARQQRELKRAP